MDLPGRPLLYGTTENFLRCFGISSPEQLPPLPRKEEAMEETTMEEMLEAEQALPDDSQLFGSGEEEQEE